VTEAIARARGELVKFLDADDLLHADCVGKLVAALDAHPTASFAFSRRDIAYDPRDEASLREWIGLPGELHSRFGPLGELNAGASLVERSVRGGFAGNWIAEPAGVMARRRDLLAVGGYSPRIRQTNDMDLWLRLMTRGDAVFVDEALYTYRLASTGVTGSS